MKFIRLVPVVIAAVFIIWGLSGNVSAFHDGSVAHCDGCHTMHNSVDGATDPDVPGGSVGVGVSTELLKGTDPSSVCLNCHAGSGSFRISSTDGSNFTPGGDFYWLGKTFSWVVRGNVVESKGDDHGHNVIAADFPGFTQDATLGNAPGGTYPSSSLYCSSCHDPHGKKANKTGPTSGSGSFGGTPAAGTELGNYRLLGDVGYNAGGGTTFTQAPPIARALPNSNPNETDDHHADYGQNMSEFCAQCHTGFAATSANAMKHPANNDAHLGTTLSNNYNQYVKTGDMSGTAATAYLALVPFERGIDDSTLLDVDSAQGPNNTSNVMCLSCHRAHATAFPNMTRWDMEEEFLIDSHPQAGDTGVTGNDVLNSYYGRDVGTVFGEFQRQLCNKCHAQD